MGVELVDSSITCLGLNDSWFTYSDPMICSRHTRHAPKCSRMQV